MAPSAKRQGKIHRKTKETTLFDTDEIPREGLTVEKLARLKPVFKTDDFKKGRIAVTDIIGEICKRQ